MAVLILNACFFTLLLFCAYVAFAQWRLSRDASLPWYIGYLLCIFVHYLRNFWVLDFAPPHLLSATPFNPPLRWDTPSSYAATICYVLFIWKIMDVQTSYSKYSPVFVWTARVFAMLLGLNILLQIVAGYQAAHDLHQWARFLTYFPMLWIAIWLMRVSKEFYQKLILIGTLAVILSVFEPIVSWLLPSDWYYYDVAHLLRRFQTPWGNFYLYHTKAGIIVDVICFSWALTLRQKILLQSEVKQQPEPLPEPEPVSVVSPEFRPGDEFLAKVHAFLSQNFGDENLRVEQIAKAVNLSIGRTNQKMKEKTCLTTEQFLLCYRLGAAKKLLLKTDNTVSEISDATGFKEVAHFSNSFKKHFGQSPSQFRQENADKVQESVG